MKNNSLKISLQISVKCYHHHHHHGCAPDWNVAVSTSCLHRPRSSASLNAEFNPWLSVAKPSAVWAAWETLSVLEEPTDRRM